MKVYLEGRIPGWTLHSLYDSLIENPPEGVDFIGKNNSHRTGDGSLIRGIDKYFSSNDQLKTILRFVKPSAYYAFYKLLSHPEQRKSADLVYSSQHVIFDHIPWIVDLESAAALLGYGRLNGYKRILEKSLASKFCRKILPWTDAGKNTLNLHLDCNRIEDKIETVHLAVPPKRFVKEANARKTRLLFVGTGNAFNIRGSFETKGGRELVLAFKKLRKEYRDIDLTIRSSVPPEYVDICRRTGIRLLTSTLSFKELSSEFQQADIFMFPGHTTPGMVILDAMSYELPVIATDVWANGEMVLDGQTGYLTKPSRFARYEGGKALLGWGEPSFRSIDRIDPEMVEDIVRKTSHLIENPALRQDMGRRGRQGVETGKFSIVERNRKLGRIFRESLGF